MGSDIEDPGQHVSPGGGGALPVLPIPVERARKDAPDFDARLPQPPFRLGLIAPTGGGKTVLAVNLLLRPHFYKDYFERVYVWSPTFEENPEWEAIEDQITSSSSDFDNLGDQINDIMEEQRGQDPMPPILMIFDDADETICKDKNVVFLLKRGRHFNISVILISQQYNTLCPKIRTQFSNIIIFRIPGGLEMSTIADRQKGHLSKAEFEEVMSIATEDPFSFLHINHQNPEADMRFTKNFDVKIF
jgi:hypothetical protein